MEYIGDVVGNEYERWFLGTNVFLTAPTGSGKTTLILEMLYKYAVEHERRMLYLVNRKILKGQIKDILIEIQNDLYLDNIRKNVAGYIEVMTYQELETMLLTNQDMNCYWQNFFYLIVDECHYFLSDATFNTKTYLSYTFVIQAWYLCRIFISATMGNIKQWILEDRKNYPSEIVEIMWRKDIQYEEYGCEKDFSYVDFDFICDDSEIIDLIKASKKEKWLIFVDNKEKGEAIHKILDDDISTVFVDAEYKSNPVEKEVDEIIKNKRMSCQVLIATSVLDNGISLIDEELKNMIIYADIKEIFFQMLGRKRCIDEERINLYVKKRTKQHFRQRINTYVSRRIEFLDNYAFQDISRWDVVLEKTLKSDWYRDCVKSLCCINQGTIVLSALSIYQFRYLYSFYKKMMKRFDEEGDKAFLYEQAEWLGIVNKEEKIKELEKRHFDVYHKKIEAIIEEYFEDKGVGKTKDDDIILSELDRKEFRERFRKDIIKILPLKVNVEDEKWEKVMVELGKKNRVYTDESFNLLMDELNLDYEMEKLKKAAKDKKYALRRKKQRDKKDEE